MRNRRETVLTADGSRPLAVVPERARPKWATRAARLVCYLAISAIATSVLLMVAITKSGVCPRFDEGAIQCTAPMFEQLGSFALSVLLLAVFGFPLSLPLVLGGVLLAVVDARRWWAGGRSARPDF